MALINRGRSTKVRIRPNRKDDGYTPNTIGNWVAVDERELPWNTIGKALESSKGKGRKVSRLMTAADVLAATGLDIKVQKFPVTDGTTGQPIPKLFVTGYDDPETNTREYFAPVSDRYEVVGVEAGLSAFDQIIGMVDGAHYSAAWNMREKSQFGVTIELPTEIVVDPNGADDRIGLHILGINSFDGSTGLSGVLSATRWFCMNQMVPTLRGTPRAFSLRHTRNIETRIAEVRALLGITTRYAEELDATANALHATAFSDRDFERFMASLKPFALDGSETDLITGRVTERREAALAAWRAPHNENITGTAWGALNVVAEYAEWGRNVNGSPRTGTDATRQRAIGTMVSPHVTGLVNDALGILVG